MPRLILRADTAGFCRRIPTSSIKYLSTTCSWNHWHFVSVFPHVPGLVISNNLRHYQHSWCLKQDGNGVVWIWCFSQAVWMTLKVKDTQLCCLSYRMKETRRLSHSTQPKTSTGFWRVIYTVLLLFFRLDVLLIIQSIFDTFWKFVRLFPASRLPDWLFDCNLEILS